MLVLAGVAAVLGLTLPLGARVLSKRRAAAASAVALEVPPSQPLMMPEAGAAPSMPGLSQLLEVGKKLQSVSPAAGAAAATVAAGVVSAAATGEVVEHLLGHGEGRGNAATIAGVVALPVAAAAAAGEKVAELVGLGDKGKQTVGHLAAAAAVAPPLALAVGGGKLLLAGVNAISPGVASFISDGLSSLDPTRTDTITGKAVGAVAGGVKTAASVLTFGLIGGKSEEEKAREAAEKEAARLKAEALIAIGGSAVAVDAARGLGGGLGNLIKQVKEADKALQPSPVPAPAPAPIRLPPLLPSLPGLAIRPAPAPAPAPPAAAVVKAAAVLRSPLDSLLKGKKNL